MVTLSYEITLIVSTLIIRHARLVEVGREVEGGIEILNTGPIQLIVPDVLSFTIKNEAQCPGMFSICYLSDPKASRHDLEQRGYVNIGGFCPTGYCTLVLEPEHKGVFGLSTERHDGNLYGMLVEGSTSMCPRYVVKYVSNFTVIAVPKCSVIIDGARFPKKETTEPKKKSSDLKWFIAIGIVFALLLLVAGAVGLYICTHSKKEAVPVKPVRHNGSSPKSHPRTSPINKKLERRPDTVCCSPKTQPSYKENFGKTESKHNRNSQKPSLKSDKCSISDEV